MSVAARAPQALSAARAQGLRLAVPTNGVPRMRGSTDDGAWWIATNELRGTLRRQNCEDRAYHNEADAHHERLVLDMVRALHEEMRFLNDHILVGVLVVAPGVAEHPRGLEPPRS